MTLQERADALIADLQAAQQSAKTSDQVAADLKKEEARVRALEREVDRKIQQFSQDKKRFDQEKAYLKTQLETLTLDQAILKKDQERVAKEEATLGVQRADLQKREDALKLQEERVQKEGDEKKIDLKDLQRRERLVAKSEAMDAERKRKLDLREKRIVAAERQYKIDAADTAIS